MPSVFGCISSGSRYGNVPNELVHRAGPSFLDNHYRGYQYRYAEFYCKVNRPGECSSLLSPILDMPLQTLYGKFTFHSIVPRAALSQFKLTLCSSICCCSTVESSSGGGGTCNIVACPSIHPTRSLYSSSNASAAL